MTGSAANDVRMQETPDRRSLSFGPAPCSPIVAVLCVAAKSIYRSLPGVECYDLNRDVRTFAGGMPIVAHPPCRSWSAYCAHQAKPEPGEKELGPLCVEWLRKCGGVLEHPAHSRLFDACQLPKPCETQDGLWTAEVLQSWWGDTRTKTTWLCFSRIRRRSVHFPIRLHDPRGDRRRWQVMSRTQRSATHPALAEWLVGVARACWANTQIGRSLKMPGVDK
jgi:hypothetical protein